MIEEKKSITGIEQLIQIVSEFYLQNADRISLLIDSGQSAGIMEPFKKELYPLFLAVRNITDSVTNLILFEFFINGIFAAIRKWTLTNRVIQINELLRLFYSIMNVEI